MDDWMPLFVKQGAGLNAIHDLYRDDLHSL